MAKTSTMEKKKDAVYHYILENILTHKYTCDEKLPEATIAKEMGISRTPIREIIQRLALEGMVKLDSNKGAFVTPIDDATMQDLALVRLKSDELSIPLAIYNGSPRQFIELRSIAEQCMAANEQGDIFRRSALDADFHLKIVEISGNNELLRMQKSIHMRVQFWLNKQALPPVEMQHFLNEHFEILECLENRDAENAIKKLQQHTMESYGIDEGKLRQMNIRLM